MKASGAQVVLSAVGRSFGTVRALDRINLRLPERGLVALVGPNGAGKSTLLDILSGAIRPSAGQIKYAGTSQRLTRRRLYRRFGRLHQRLVVPETLATGHYLCLASKPHAVFTRSGMLSRDWCQTSNLLALHIPALETMLRSADVTGAFATPIGKLSHGQQRVIAIAAILSVPQRHGVLLDEPFAGLGPTVKAAVCDALGDYARDRLVVIAEHDLDTVQDIADVMIVMVAGQLVAQYQGQAVRSADLLSHFLLAGVPR